MVADHVIQFFERNRTDIAQIGHLHRGGTIAQGPQTGPLGHAVQIHQNVDFVFADFVGQLFFAHVADQGQMVEGRQDALAHVAAVVLGGAIAIDLELAAVMGRGQGGHHAAGRAVGEAAG